MMHRDLKSPNVLLSEEGVAKIADVGMVRAQVKALVTAQPVMTPLGAARVVTPPPPPPRVPHQPPFTYRVAAARGARTSVQGVWLQRGAR